MKIVIDAGHGPETAGKRCPDDSMREYHFNSAVAHYVEQLLGQYEGAEILFVHDDSRDVPLEERVQRANEWGADVYVSIHANAYGSGWNEANGIETFVYVTRPDPAVALAAAVQSNLIRMTDRRDRGVKTAVFHVLRETDMTAILIECGFMTNQEEAELLKSDSYRQQCASAIATGIVETYGLQAKPVEQPSVNPYDEVSEWARDAQGWAMNCGITDGTRPRDPVTREEVWTMMQRALR